MKLNIVDETITNDDYLAVFEDIKAQIAYTKNVLRDLEAKRDFVANIIERRENNLE